MSRKTGGGIVEKEKGNYIKSDSYLLKKFDHGDHVFCFEVDDLEQFLDNIEMAHYKLKFALVRTLEEIMLVETEEDLKTLKKQAYDLKLKLND